MVGDQPLRYGSAAIFETPCDVAAEIAILLQRAGWSSHPRRCFRSTCTVHQAPHAGTRRQLHKIMSTGRSDSGFPFITAADS
jgi:hypothetical protein